MLFIQKMFMRVKYRISYGNYVYASKFCSARICKRMADEEGAS